IRYRLRRPPPGSCALLLGWSCFPRAGAHRMRPGIHTVLRQGPAVPAPSGLWSALVVWDRAWVARGGRRADREQVRAAFEEPKEFTTSPLYRCLGRTVAATDELLDLARQGRPGQYPTFLFFGAVHLLLLAGAEHPLARFYPSIVGERALASEGAGPALI